MSRSAQCAREHLCVCVCVRACARARASLSVCVRAYVCVCVDSAVGKDRHVDAKKAANSKTYSAFINLTSFSTWSTSLFEQIDKLV